ncbi:F-box protein FBW2 [Musa troglodytarum]|uniref:F-box protein FBW2 n=1 Tax=Musa troglodytarum TaxID=320322 RepID=A0A9E7FUW8_9LILI|nr:F-box protein FBW2 [Musa troglodytarum]
MLAASAAPPASLGKVGPSSVTISELEGYFMILITLEEVNIEFGGPNLVNELENSIRKPKQKL